MRARFILRARKIAACVVFFAPTEQIYSISSPAHGLSRDVFS
jgi:hypothetical protein